MPDPRDYAALRAVCESISRRAATLASMGMLPASAVSRAEKAVEDAGAMEDIIEERFASSSTSGARWVDRKRPYPWRPLERTGAMKDAAKAAVAGTYVVGRRPSWNAWNIRSTYARFHQQGTGTLPKRPFFDDPTDDDLEEADAIAAGAMKEELDRMLGGGA